MHLIKALWKGEIPLATTFFAFGMSVVFILNLYIGFFDPSYYTGPRSLITMTIDIFAFVYLPFIGICIWRSANKYKGNKVWAILAKIMSLGVWRSWFGVILYYAKLNERIGGLVFGVVILILIAMGAGRSLIKTKTESLE